jgi:hypothetical protein
LVTVAGRLGIIPLESVCPEIGYSDWKSTVLLLCPVSS